MILINFEENWSPSPQTGVYQWIRCDKDACQLFSVINSGYILYQIDQVQQNLGCAATEDGKRLEISDLGSTCRGIVLSSRGVPEIRGKVP